MSAETQNPRRVSFGGIFRFFAFRFIPALLLIAIIWTVIQIVSVFWGNYTSYADTTSRQDAYAATASAIAPDEREEGSLGEIRLMQFTTNTPQGGGEAPDNSGGFPTNTPLATDIPPATQVSANS